MPDGPSRNGPGPSGPDYAEDFYAWTQHQAEVLRSMPCDDNRFDRDHVAEEIEDLGKSERNAVRSETRRIIDHLLKLHYSSATDPQADWMASIVGARAELEERVSAMLRRDLEASLPRLFRSARKQAEPGLRRYAESGAAAALPDQCPYTLDQILEDDWYPEPPATEEA